MAKQMWARRAAVLRREPACMSECGACAEGCAAGGDTRNRVDGAWGQDNPAGQPRFQGGSAARAVAGVPLQ